MRPSPAFRTLVVLAAISSWALVGVGGVVRVSESGLGCPDWPLCDGRMTPAAAKEPVLEYTHRATAAVAIVLLLATTTYALRRYRDRLEIVVPLTVAAVLVPVQALLGAAVVWLELPEHLVGVHFMGRTADLDALDDRPCCQVDDGDVPGPDVRDERLPASCFDGDAVCPGACLERGDQGHRRRLDEGGGVARRVLRALGGDEKRRSIGAVLARRSLRY